MKRTLPPHYLALFLILFGVLYSLVASRFPYLISNFSPIMAIAFVGAMHLPRRWGWLVGPVLMIFTELAYLPRNLASVGATFSSLDVISRLCIYAAVGGLGLLIFQRKSLVKVLSGSVASSLLFYVVTNTTSWWGSIGPDPSGYAPTLAGWWQANTVGLTIYPVPSWVFLRNGIAGDLFFTLVLLLVLDRGLVLGRAGVKSETAATARTV